ncbi:hypothetical protein BUE80_DR004391 [Diplocarpon rosae]|nr:hypothetical protein BUE80_DR004391 [Diplocarpon rosae]
MWKRGAITKAPARTFFWSTQPTKDAEARLSDQTKTESEARAEFEKPASEVAKESEGKPRRGKTIWEQDEELRLKLEGISGEGGAAGVDLLHPTMAPSTRKSLEPMSSSGPKGTKRPNEDPSPAPAGKRGRGRPKKIQKTLEETLGGGEDSVMEGGIEDDAEIAKHLESSPPAQAKRIRGRPKKAQKANDDDAEVAKHLESSPPAQAKKTRGRPKKVQKGNEENREDNKIGSGVEGEKEAVSTKGKGRPKNAPKQTGTSSGEALEDKEADKEVTRQSHGNANEQANEPETVDFDSKKITNNNVGDEKAIVTQSSDGKDATEADAPKKTGEDADEDVDSTKPIATQSKDDIDEEETDAPEEAGEGVDEDVNDKKVTATPNNDTLAEKESNGPEEIGQDVDNIKDHDIDDDEEVAKQMNGRSDNLQSNGHDVEGEKNACGEVKAEADDPEKGADQEQEATTGDIKHNASSIVEDDQRQAAMPSSILEKGIIYFFFRGRVGVEDPQGLEDVARSYIVLRPLPLGAKLGAGALEDLGNSRLLALPKKMLPKSRQDRFLVFVEQPQARIQDLREQFASNAYATQTSGTSHSPAATPFAEGIYAITSTGRESHLAYHITIPAIGEVQTDLGLHEKGSFVVSAKNPHAPGPAHATLPHPAQYPENIQAKFRDLRWMPLEPALLEYRNTQFLLIGEGLGEMDRAVEETSKDAKDDAKEKPVQEMETLEQEDQERIAHLRPDDPIFADLGLSSQEYPEMQTTW